MRGRRFHCRRLRFAIPRRNSAHRFARRRFSRRFGTAVRSDAEDMPVGHRSRSACDLIDESTTPATTTAAAPTAMAFAFMHLFLHLRGRLCFELFFDLDLNGSAVRGNARLRRLQYRVAATASATAATPAAPMTFTFMHFTFGDDDRLG